MAPFALTPALTEEIKKIAARYEQKRAAMLPVLHVVQNHFGHITPELEQQVGALLDVPSVHVHEVVSFYSMFRTKDIGRNHIQMCSNVSCCLLGAENLIDHVSQKLNIKPGETTSDGKFTLSSVECLCACEVAPMLQWNEEYVGSLTKEKLNDLIEKAK